MTYRRAICEIANIFLNKEFTIEEAKFLSRVVELESLYSAILFRSACAAFLVAEGVSEEDIAAFCRDNISFLDKRFSETEVI